MIFLWARKLSNKAMSTLFEERIINKQVLKEQTPSILFVLERETSDWKLYSKTSRGEINRKRPMSAKNGLMVIS